jgi:carbamoyltransferase
VLHQIPLNASLGNFYLDTVVHLGFRIFDEYKVMGLAPYGDPAVFRGLFESCYALLPNGEYTLDRGPLAALDVAGITRRPGTPIEQAHRDVAAALQEALETIVLHVMRHYGAVTGHRRLCLAGGVAHNCSMNGKLFYSGLFDSIFVQPAAHDAGTAIGAALLAQPASVLPTPETRLEHVYLGREVEAEAALGAELASMTSRLTLRGCWRKAP